MPRARRTRASSARAGTLPSKSEIIEFIDTAPGRVGRRDIARAFNVKAADRNALGQLMREIRAERGDERAKGDGRDGLPPVGIATVSGVDGDGDVSVVPTLDDGAAGPFPLRGLKREAISVALGPGDRVLVRFVTGDEDGEGSRRHARLIRKLPGGERRITGIVSGPSGGKLWLQPVSKRAREDVELDTAGKDVLSGDLVTAELGRSRTAKVVTVHGNATEPGQLSLIAIHEFGIPHEFPREALDEASTAREPSPDSRADLSHVPFVTIDPEDARDHDDAVHAAPDPDPKNPGGWIVQVAIADVAHFVRPGSALDREARRRGNSVYFPDRVVPMLPEELSTDLCSLKAGEPRAAVVVRMVVDTAGTLRSHSVSRAIIVSRANLTYAEAQEAIEKRPSKRAVELVDDALRPLWGAYGALARARENRGPLEFDLPERRILFDKDGRPSAVVTPPRLDSHRLIEEFMIQANVAAAETLDARSLPFLRRIHDAPAPEKAEALGQYAQSLGFSLPRGQTLNTALFNRLVDQASATEHSEAVAQAVLRAQSQALYAARDRGHFGLNLRRYAHFTSPIRRYADIVAHRALISALSLGSGGYDRETIAALDEIGGRISDAERVAMAAERATIDRLIAQLLQSQVGARFSGRISGVVRSGLFVELDDTGANGFVAAADLGRRHGDYFAADEAPFSLAGRDSGLGYRIGERVDVRLIDVSPLRGMLDFEMLTEPQRVPQGRRSSRRPTRRARRQRVT